MVVIMGIWVALKMLVLPEVVSNVIANAYQVIIALLVGWLLSRLFDALYRQYLQTSHLKLMTGLKSQVTMAWSSK